MNKTLLPKLKELYNKFQQTEDYKNRKEQFKVVEVNKSIIKTVLAQGPLTNEFLSGFIQMFKFGCSDKTFDKYLALCVENEITRQELSDHAYKINQWGYTGAGLNSIYGLNDNQLETVKIFLLNAFETSSIEDAKQLCQSFEAKKIPLVTAGIYSPWLYYINPQIFPILNNSHTDFKKWIDIALDYPSAITDFALLRIEVGEVELGGLDLFAHNFKKYSVSDKNQILDLDGKRLFKISHGVFSKTKAFKELEFTKILENNNWICLHRDTGKQQGNDFVDDLSSGDFVYVCYGGDKLVCIAKIISDARFLDKEYDEMVDGKGKWVIRDVEPIFYPINSSIREFKKDARFFMPSGNSTLYEVPKNLNEMNEKIFKPKFNVELTNSLGTGLGSKIVEQSINPLNQILYGPPGTGKTYNSLDKAVNIVTGKSGKHAENKKVFDQLRKDGQIEFVTFHQGYSYEDFMVGIKPNVDSDQLTFKPYKGIFYRLVERAKENYLASKEERSMLKSFDEVFEALLNPFEKNEDVEIKMASGASFKITDVQNGTIRFKKPNGSDTHTLSVETLKAIVEGKRKFNSGLGVYYQPLVKQLKESQHSDEPKAVLKNYILIIDEINRANISKVFGELITLLEDDKRIDADNSLSVTLPNGEMNFSIPPNLYIIGTMNTADKSISLIDVALRRRFEFLGYYPDPNILMEKYSDRIELLQKLNEAIFTKKKTADYLIGHGYFMKAENTELIVLNKIIPLLMEYFSGRVEEVTEILKQAGKQVRYNTSIFKWEFDAITTTVNESSAG